MAVCGLTYIYTTGIVAAGTILAAPVAVRWFAKYDGCCSFEDLHVQATSLKVQKDAFVRVYSDKPVRITSGCSQIATELRTAWADDCPQTSALDIYANMGCLVKRGADISDAIINLVGMKARWFAIEGEAPDAVFKEYRLHSVRAQADVKLVAEDGALPSTAPHTSLTEWGIDEDRWQVSVSARHFENAFGCIPKARDIVYIEAIDRLFTVKEAWKESKESLMGASLWWTVVLGKYNDNASVAGDISPEPEIDMDCWFGHAEETLELASGAASQTVYPADNRPYYSEYEDLLRIIKTEPRFADVSLYHNGVRVVNHAYNSGNTIKYKPEICSGCGLTVSYILLKSDGAEPVEINIGEDTIYDTREADAPVLVIISDDGQKRVTKTYKYTEAKNRLKSKFELYSSDEAKHSDASGSASITIPDGAAVSNIKIYEGVVDDKELLKNMTSDEACRVCDTAERLGEYGLTFN